MSCRWASFSVIREWDVGMEANGRQFHVAEGIGAVYRRGVLVDVLEEEGDV